MKNSAGQGGCYPPRLKAEVDNILRDLSAEFFIFYESRNSIIALLFIQNIFFAKLLNLLACSHFSAQH